MNRVKNHTKELITLTILFALTLSVVNAAVFVYYPIDITAQWGPRPVYFEKGTNADQPDLSEKEKIEVRLSDDNTSASITVHPSRMGMTYYKDVLRIVNGDGDRAYYIGFTVNTAFTNDSISKAYLIVKNPINDELIGRVDLRSTETTWEPWTLGTNSQLRVDLMFVISSSGKGSDKARIYLVYSPTYEKPPSGAP
ncbi:MAG: hypothetical protein ACUVQY_11445 [Thermoproteota archaeon]